MARKISEKAEHIRAVPLFRGLGKRALDRVARHVDEVHVEQGKVIASEGDTGRELLIIVEGTAKVQRGGRTIAKLSDGDFLGEMSLIDGKPRSATVTAETPMTLLTIHTRAFKGLLDDVPRMKDEILKGLVQRLRAADDSIIE